MEGKLAVRTMDAASESKRIRSSWKNETVT